MFASWSLLPDDGPTWIINRALCRRHRWETVIKPFSADGKTVCRPQAADAIIGAVDRFHCRRKISRGSTSLSPQAKQNWYHLFRGQTLNFFMFYFKLKGYVFFLRMLFLSRRLPAKENGKIRFNFSARTWGWQATNGGTVCRRTHQRHLIRLKACTPSRSIALLVSLSFRRLVRIVLDTLWRFGIKACLKVI